MTDAPLHFITSPNGDKWSDSQTIVNGYSDYGLQMAVYRGELYGIMTQTVQYPKQLFATKYKIGEGWRTWRSLPQNYLSQGRVSVTVLEDRFFILRRGTNDAVYLCWTDNFDTWHDVGRVGSQYAKTMASPAICAHNGKLYIAGVGEDNAIYFCITDENGEREVSWKKINGTGTQSALSMVVYRGQLYLFHCGYKGNKFYYQTMGDDGNWSSLNSYTTNVTSGISAVSWKYDELVITYRGRDQDIKWQAFDGKDWTIKKYIPDVYMKYQTGLSTWGGQLVVSFAQASPGKSSSYRSPPLSMGEKDLMFSEVREVNDDEWDCKWNDDQKKKPWLKKFFCL